ncbi:alpha/beta hydrolase [Candidatus Promineifilum breve]|nr:alpha/beta hydrolase [Candidatus Promineifilum breve]
MKISRLIVLIVIALVPTTLFAGAGGVAAQSAVGSFIPGPCVFEGIEVGPTSLTGEALGFECGYVVVPERHAAPDGPTIQLPIAIRRATAADARPDPLFVAQGGPGGDAFQVFTLLAPTAPFAANRDIVIFNQRGTPYALPELTCPETTEVMPQMLALPEAEAQAIFNQAMAACYARLQAEGVDLSAYNSLENAADIPIIARALGYDEYNFYGVSYGTLLGLHLMRNHPAGLRSVILDSVVPTDINFISETAQSEARVLSEVFAACAADPVCREQYPNLEERFYALIRQYDANPITLSLTDPETGESHDAYVDGNILRSVLFQLLYVLRMNAILPKVIADLEQGDTRYVEAMWPLLVFDQQVAWGMYFSVICAEDADIDVAGSIEGLPPEIAATARYKLQSYLDTCARWPVELLPASVDEPVISDIPTLLLSGRFDPITPPAFAQATAAGLSNATTLLDPTASHGVAFFSPCVNEIVGAFLDDPSTTPDSSCLAEQAAATVVPPDAVTWPLLSGFNNLKTGTLAMFGLAGLLVILVASPFLVWPIAYLVRAFGEKQATNAPEQRRLRLISRAAVLLFGLLAVVFAGGLSYFILATVVADQTLATALALPAAARPVLWLPLLLLVLAVFIVVMTFLLWWRAGSGSTAGKVYYTFVAVVAVGLVVLLGTQGLLLPPL